MKVGDLARCLFQPTTSRVQHGLAIPMIHIIKGEMGIILKTRSNGCHRVLFPQFGYEHDITSSSLEIVSESR